MSERSISREIQFEAVFNFRDLGGYRTRANRTVSWRRLFRSGELRHATATDIKRLREEIRLRSVLDLRAQGEVDRDGIGRLSETGVRRYSIPLITDGTDSSGDMERLREQHNTGELYSLLISNAGYGQRLVECLEIIAEPDNHPLVFHCSAGKDRTAILASILLSLLSVRDDDIIKDYTLTAPYMRRHIDRLSENPEMAKFLNDLPDWMHEASAHSMEVFLSTLRREYGSAREYLETRGAEHSLFVRLEGALLVPE